MHVLGLLHTQLLHGVPHPDHVLSGHGGVGPLHHPPGPFVGQDLLLKVQVKMPLKALKSEPESIAITQRAAVDIIAGN